MVRTNRLLVLALLLLTVGAAQAIDSGEEARDWLERMSDALHELDYDGTFVYLHGNDLQAMRIIHHADDTGEYERLISLTGLQREVIRNNDQVTCILPDDTSFVVDRRPRKSFPLILPRDVARLEHYYNFELGETARMTGRDAQRIVIRPRDAYRYGYRFWLDGETGMLLKSELLDEEQEPVEQFMFTSLEFLTDVPARLLEPGVSGEKFLWYHHEERSGEAPPPIEGDWRVSRLPAGFRLDIYRRHFVADSEIPLEHMVYTDGLSSVSVFIERLASGQAPIRGASTRGAVNAYGTVVDGYQITVVGEVPRAAVAMIAESIERGGGS